MRFLIDSDHFQSFLRDRKKRIMDPRTNGQTDGRTDKPSYRDAWTHLKRSLFGFDWSLLIFLLLFAFLQSVAVAVVVVVIDVR